MSWWQAVLLGIIQGVTEFLPISSSGHLVLTQYYLGWGETDSAQEVFFDGVLHLGTVVAVLLYFASELRGQLARLIKPSLALRASNSPPSPLLGEGFGVRGTASPKLAPTTVGAPQSEQSKIGNLKSQIPWPTTYRDLLHLAILVAVATLPAACVALVESEAIKESFKYPRPVAFNFLVLGGVLMLTSFLKSGPTSGPTTRLWQVLLIGMAQAGSAVFRGLSRSGMTISASLIVGFERNWAVRFSFMMSVAASLGLGGLGVVKALKDPHRDQWLSGDFLLMTLAATCISAVVGYVTIDPLIRLVRRARLWWFAVYLWLLAAAVLVST
jgi:undecaprenyl-diphosphatase